MCRMASYGSDVFCAMALMWSIGKGRSDGFVFAIVGVFAMQACFGWDMGTAAETSASDC